MKKTILSFALVFLMNSKSDACAWYDPDYDYFNLFTQSIIKDKTYLPFLHTMSNRFYGHEHYEIPNENIENWQKYFGNSLSYSETQILVEKMPMKDLNAFKKGSTGNSILSKLGSYQKYYEGIDYLIEAKYLEPYMRINYVESPDSFYNYGDDNEMNANKLGYDKTIAALTSLYNAAKNPEIKLRYGYQLVRFNHYTRNYESSVAAFKKYVEPLKLKTSPYFLALDQLAGAQSGLSMKSEANYNFFQVFMNSKSRKESAFISMKIADSASFDNLLKLAKNPEEKNMAYFLLGYQDFNNPIPMMEKMYEIDPNSEILKVLAARSINELERSYLPTSISDYEEGSSPSKIINQDQSENSTLNTSKNEPSIWQKIKNFFSNLFSSSKTENGSTQTDKSDHDLLNNPNRLPFYSKHDNYYTDNKTVDFLNDFEKLTSKIKGKANDEFWQIADAYLSFLKKDYAKSSATLNEIKTNNPEYIKEIDRMKMLNDITSQAKITTSYEDYLVQTYPKLLDNFVEEENTSDSYGQNKTSTQDFIRDILANRYFIQGEKGKSFLMSNMLSDLQFNPNLELVKSVHEFYKKSNKSKLEQKIIAKNINDVGDIDAFFNLIYGDKEMHLAHFEKAKQYYAKAVNFKGISRYDYTWNDEDERQSKKKVYGEAYDGFKNISPLVFGHNVWESFQSPDTETMKSENYSGFPFIQKDMNKLELAEAAVQLKKIGMGTDLKAAEANQLLGNLLYNTSILGYYRELFVMDIDNSNGGKYNFYNSDQPTFKYYYKNFSSSNMTDPDNFDLSISYYKKALALTKDDEQKARILFQMASAEQGKYYQFESTNDLDLKYDDPEYDRKQEELMTNLNKTKNSKYRTYFMELKNKYAHTKTSKSLQTSCSYYDYFLRKQ